MKSWDLLENKFDFKVERMTYQKNVSMATSHYHSHYEILYIESGSRIISVNETKKVELTPENIALLPPNIIHATKSNSEMQTRVLLNVSQKLIDEIVGFSSRYVLSGFDTIFLPVSPYDIKIFKYHVQQLLDMQQRPEYPLKDDSIKIELAALLMDLANVNYNLVHNFDAHKPSFEALTNMDNVIDYIVTHYYEDISLAELADKAAMSKQHFIKCFTEKYNTTPIKYLNTFRIVTAQRLLEDSQMSVSSVANACGFNSNAHFSRTFKQVTGITPKEYQINFKNKSR